MAPETGGPILANARLEEQDRPEPRERLEPEPCVQAFRRYVARDDGQLNVLRTGRKRLLADPRHAGRGKPPSARLRKRVDTLDEPALPPADVGVARKLHLPLALSVEGAHIGQFTRAIDSESVFSRMM